MLFFSCRVAATCGLVELAVRVRLRGRRTQWNYPSTYFHYLLRVMEPLPAVIGEGKVTLWKSHQFFTVPHRKSKSNYTHANTRTQIVSFHLRRIGENVTRRQVASWQENECDSGGGRGRETRWRSWMKKMWLSRETRSYSRYLRHTGHHR